MLVPIHQYLIWWQIEKEFMGHTRWVHMDDWFNSVTEYGFQQYMCCGRRPRPMLITYNGNQRAGPIDYEFEYGEQDCWQTNMRTGERCKIRRIEFRVLAPSSQQNWLGPRFVALFWKKWIKTHHQLQRELWLPGSSFFIAFRSQAPKIQLCCI